MYRNKIRMQNVSKTLKNIYGTRSLINNFKSSVNRDESTAIAESHIIHIETLGEQLLCKNCGAILSLLDFVEERRFGLASVFYIKCHSCKIITDVYIDKPHQLHWCITAIMRPTLCNVACDY